MSTVTTHITIQNEADQYRRPFLPFVNACGVTVNLAILCFIALLPIQANALEFQCSVPGDIRYLRVDIPGEEKLCEVSVKYEHSGERKVMWYAENDTLFCSAKAYELHDKYEDLWGFDCRLLPDRDGIDELSPSHRAILDTQLKAMIARGITASEPFKVTAVKATASTPLDGQPGTLALQYFRSNGDVTQIIADNGTSWEVFATINDMASHITGDATVNSALINTITDSGAVELTTSVADGQSLNCRGKQVLMVEADNKLRARTPHRYVCATVADLSD